MPDAFCINGIEIDLKELEVLERRVAAKKKLQAASASTSATNITSFPTTSQNNENLEECFEKSLQIRDDHVNDTVSQPVPDRQQPSLPTMFMVIMSIFSILNQIYYKPTAQS